MITIQKHIKYYCDICGKEIKDQDVLSSWTTQKIILTNPGKDETNDFMKFVFQTYVISLNVSAEETSTNLPSNDWALCTHCALKKTLQELKDTNQIK